MAIFHISAWQGEPDHGKRIWQAEVVAENVDEGYRIGKKQFASEYPDLKMEEYTIVANGDSVEKSISV